MKVINPNTEVNPVGPKGVAVGDQILFSSHNIKNTVYAIRLLTQDKLYTIEAINQQGQAFFSDDVGVVRATENPQGWDFDIIVKAAVKVTEFKPVSLVMETQEEVELIDSLFGGLTGHVVGQYVTSVGGRRDLIGKIYNALPSNNKKKVQLLITTKEQY